MIPSVHPVLKHKKCRHGAFNRRSLLRGVSSEFLQPFEQRAPHGALTSAVPHKKAATFVAFNSKKRRQRARYLNSAES